MAGRGASATADTRVRTHGVSTAMGQSGLLGHDGNGAPCISSTARRTLLGEASGSDGAAGRAYFVALLCDARAYSAGRDGRADRVPPVSRPPPRGYTRSRAARTRR